MQDVGGRVLLVFVVADAGLGVGLEGFLAADLELEVVVVVDALEDEVDEEAAEGGADDCNGDPDADQVVGVGVGGGAAVCVAADTLGVGAAGKGFAVGAGGNARCLRNRTGRNGRSGTPCNFRINVLVGRWVVVHRFRQRFLVPASTISEAELLLIPRRIRTAKQIRSTLIVLKATLTFLLKELLKPPSSHLLRNSVRLLSHHHFLVERMD